MALQEQQAGEAEHHTGNGEQIDEPAPGFAAVTALVQVVEVGDPAALGRLVFQLAAFQAKTQPGIAARTWQGDVEFAIEPLAFATGQLPLQALFPPYLLVSSQPSLRTVHR